MNQLHRGRHTVITGIARLSRGRKSSPAGHGARALAADLRTWARIERKLALVDLVGG
jgi:hypothetical protein